MKAGVRLQEGWASLSRFTRLLLLLALLLAVSSSYSNLRLSEHEPQSRLHAGIASIVEIRETVSTSKVEPIVMSSTSGM